MSEFLLFTIYAPFASWGDIAVGEVRGSWDRPSRSAVFGLLGACLGLDRDDQPAHDALSKGLGFAVRLDLPGHAEQDYHTAQTSSQVLLRKVKPKTRSEFVRMVPDKTILSARTYRLDSIATCALWSEGASPYTLEQLAEALRRPHWIPYAGRRANAIGLPFNPVLCNAETLAAAFASRSSQPGVLDTMTLAKRQQWGNEIAFDRSSSMVSGISAPTRTVVRRDVSTNRAQMHFVEREVQHALLSRETMEEGGSDQ